MSIIKHTTAERDLLARIMRSEALGEGNLGMLMVGNVVVNRGISNCYTFKNINTIYDVIYQANQFSGINNSLFYSSPTTKEKELADRVLRGDYFYPATNALWFYAPGTSSCKNIWYNQSLSGRYKSHCFYKPDSGICRALH
ncbi:MAG: cell wall hydrolase [Bacilli bacterium]|nr:cell wall hydrolase [Bacilli bacterium]